jgi:hypothetical protein
MVRIMETDIYDRQKELNLNIPEKVAVIGCGGVGSWTALSFALVGVKELHLYDFDTVEESNLNRTPFKVSQIGINKCEAIAKLIYERRPEAKVYCYNTKVDENTEFPDVNVIIDCRDNSTPIKNKGKVIVIGGYDGSKITIHYHPTYKKVWGDEPVRYTITPSYLIPPMFISCIIVNYICLEEFWKNTEEKIINLDLKELSRLLIKIKEEKR